MRQNKLGGAWSMVEWFIYLNALKGKNVQKTGTVIGLYMPPAVNVSYNMDYSEGKLV